MTKSDPTMARPDLHGKVLHNIILVKKKLLSVKIGEILEEEKN